MKLEIGKQYVWRDGKITDKLIPSLSEGHIKSGYIFLDQSQPHGRTYTIDGVFCKGETKDADLICEYTDPSPVNEIEQRLAACEAKQAEHDAMLARIAALLGLSDTPKAEQPEPPSRYFCSKSFPDVVWMLAGEGVFVRGKSDASWTKTAISVEELLDSNTPEITAEQAEAILKGGGL
jgi:hypothetical protein